MTETSVVEIGLAFIGVLFSVIGYMLSQKDAAQAELIKDLYRKHEADERSLYEHKEELARMHYTKNDLDPKFTRLENAMVSGFESLGNKFDKLAGTLLEHIHMEDRRKGEQ